MKKNLEESTRVGKVVMFVKNLTVQSPKGNSFRMHTQYLCLPNIHLNSHPLP